MCALLHDEPLDPLVILWGVSGVSRTKMDKVIHSYNGWGCFCNWLRRQPSGTAAEWQHFHRFHPLPATGCYSEQLSHNPNAIRQSPWKPSETRKGCRTNSCAATSLLFWEVVPVESELVQDMVDERSRISARSLWLAGRPSTSTWHLYINLQNA